MQCYINMTQGSSDIIKYLPYKLRLVQVTFPKARPLKHLALKQRPRRQAHRGLAKDLSLLILAGSLDPGSLGSLDSEKISKRLKSVYFGCIPGYLDPWILGF